MEIFKYFNSKNKHISNITGEFIDLNDVGIVINDKVLKNQLILNHFQYDFQ